MCCGRSVVRCVPYSMIVHNASIFTSFPTYTTSRYPDCTFSLEDALTTKGTAKLRSLCMEKLVGGYPSVVAIDINGNREIPAVLKCIENFMNPSDDVVVEKDWALPRLIVVKSRLLYAEMKKQQEEEENGGV